MTAKAAMFCRSHFRELVTARLLRTLVDCSAKLDAERRLALQEEKQALEAKLLEV